MKKRQILTVVMAMVMSAALCACGGGKTDDSTRETSNTLSEGTPVEGGSLVFGMTQTLTSLDPHNQTDAGTREMVFNMYEGLVKPTSDGDIVPAIASDYEISDDAKTYTFTLRDGVKFHDGTTVTAEDVKYSIDRYAEVQGETSAFCSVADSTEIKDDKTILVHLKEGYTEFLSMMTVIAIVPEANDDLLGNPVGTGPFKFVSTSAGENIVMERYEDYWGEKAHLDQVTFKFIADVDTAYMELQAGTIDVLRYLTTDQVNGLGDDYNIYEGSMNLVHGMYLNNEYEPLSNVKVRQALCYAVDRDAINNFLFGGKSKIIGTHMIPAFSKYYNEDTVNAYPYDPAKAKELLAEAGYADGFDLELKVASSYSQHVNTCQIIAEQLKAVGINATINQVEWNTWLEEVNKNGDFQATVIGFDISSLSPADLLRRFTSDSPKNFMHYYSDAFDQTFNAAYSTVSDEEKITLYKEAQQILTDDAAAVWIEDPANLVAMNKKFAGYTFYPTSAEDMSKIYMVEQ